MESPLAPGFIRQNALWVGFPPRIRGSPSAIHAPLIRWSKAAIIREGTRLGVDYGATVSSYKADAEGRACGRCNACRLRRAGFEQSGPRTIEWE